MDQELAALRRLAVAQGWIVGMSGSNRLQWLSPSGKRVYSSATSCSHRGLENVKTMLTQAGLRGARSRPQKPQKQQKKTRQKFPVTVTYVEPTAIPATRSPLPRPAFLGPAPTPVTTAVEPQTVARPAPTSWSMADAIKMLRDGYQLPAVARRTKFSVEELEAVAADLGLTEESWA